MRKLVVAGLAILLVALVSRVHTRQSGPAANPAAGLLKSTPVPPEVASVLREACFDCHSEETRWPWYSNLPIVGDLLERDVANGRAQLNFSRWTVRSTFERANLLDTICTQVTEGRMPLKPYRLMHPDARLTPKDVDLICHWTGEEIRRVVQGGS